MNLKHISDAITAIDTELISESLERPAADKGVSRRPLRKWAAIAAAVCLVSALSVTAYALNISGIRDLLGHTHNELTADADRYIVPHGQIIEGDYWTCRVTESLTAGGTVMVALNITCDEDYILNGGMDIPSNEEIAQGVGSFAYAEQQGKTPLYIGAVIHGGDVDLSGFITSCDETVSDHEMNILLQRDKLTADPLHEIECILDVREIRLENGAKVYDETDRTSFTIELSEAPVLESEMYLSYDGGSIPGLSFESVVIDRTVVGDTVTLTASVTDEIKAYDIKLLRCGEMAEFHNFHTWTEDGKFFWRWTLAEIGSTDTLTVSAFNQTDEGHEWHMGDVCFVRG